MNIDITTIKKLSVDGANYFIALPNFETDYIQKNIFNTSMPYEHTMLKNMSRRLQKGSLVLDVGANIGNHTLYLAAVNGCKVHAFEPNSSLCNALNKSVEENGLSGAVSVHNVGVGSTTGKAKFVNENEANLGGQSLLIGDEEQAAINVICLDDQQFNAKVAAIKIDVEGMELDVLNGAIELITKDKPEIYVECQKKDDFLIIAEWMTSRGYIYRESYNATPTHLFIHQEKLTGEELPEKTLINLRGFIYEQDESERQKNEQLNAANLKYREVNKQLINVKEKLDNKIEIERKLHRDNDEVKRELNQKIVLLKKELSIAQKLPCYILTKKILRLKRLLSSPEKMKKVSKRVARRVLHLKFFFKSKLNQKENIKVNPSIVPARDLDKLNVEKLKNNLNKELKVACIMDDFTWSSYSPECELMQLTPARWQEELENGKPDLLFIESAWRGKDQLWGNKVGHTSQELQEILRWCRERNIPTIFWNKEDPVHFETFLNTARLFDYVFTTDIDCVPRYKASLEHNEVYFLPFACQPREHNPVEKYVRKEAFCFAGAYYARYPERTNDLEELVATLPEYRPLDIYDRNYGKDDENYAFPKAFQPYIVGTLPFSEIDKAYKGYRYAINLNSIKQSQSMFARRVYELLASNTITVSNYSRGLRLMFGDLVLCSDSGKQLVNELESLNTNDKTDRIRLAALRKVMSQHTYEDRLSYVISRITGTEQKDSLPSFRMIGMANSEPEANKLLEQWRRQQGVSVSLTIVYTVEIENKLDALKRSNDSEVVWLPKKKSNAINLTDLAESDEWIAGISSSDYYGPNYLLDIALATRYQAASIIGKEAKYHWQDKACTLENSGKEYKPAEALLARCSVIQYSAALEIRLSKWLDALDDLKYVGKEQFAVDRFNYCANVMNENDHGKINSIVNDIEIDSGMILADLNKAAEASEPKRDIDNGSHELTGAFIGKMIRQEVLYEDYQHQLTKVDENRAIRISRNTALYAEINNLNLNLVSNLEDGQHEYIYCPENVLIESILKNSNNTRVHGLPIHLEADPGLSLSLVVQFYDDKNEKIGHLIESANRNTHIVIPDNAFRLRFGVRIYSKGSTTIRRLIFGHKNLEPGQIFGKSDTLLLTNHYPSYEDLYRNGFVHSRVKAYAERQVLVDIFRLRHEEKLNFHEFEKADVITASEAALEHLLSSGGYKQVLVHFLDEKMWSVLENYLDTIKITIWIHGAEIQPWWRREYNYLDSASLEKAKEESLGRVAFWEKVFLYRSSNLHFVFVSNYFANEVMEDIGVKLSSDSYDVVHNPIDTDIFSYHIKSEEQRKRILSIRPYASRKYANDISVNTVLELSKEDFFEDLDFLFVGDGPLFDEVLEPLTKFSNVKILRKFLSQKEIAKLHKEYGLFLCPTRMDAQGVSKDEAMASGLIPVTNAVTAIPEFVDETCGVLAQAEDHLALAAGIKAMYLEPKIFNKKSAAASQRARVQVSKTVVIDKELSLIGVYE